MRAKTVIFLLLSAFIMVWAGRTMTLPSQQKAASIDSIEALDYRPSTIDSTNTLAPRLSTIDSPDTLDSQLSTLDSTAPLDSLHLAILRHNQLIDDSIRLDSIQRAKANGIESPVKYSAKDSMVYYAGTKAAYLYGSSTIDYQNMKLQSEKIYTNLDSSMIRATGAADSLEKSGLRGKPHFTMGDSDYDSDTIAFNFKSKRGLIGGVYTEQEDGYLTGERAKRDSSGTIYLKHGRYTTCDDPHPDFYISLSRAKVRPGKDVVFGPAYLVVADVPLPLAIPYGFFPFSKKYSSGFIMPSYGDEQSRGLYLRDGGYYFAASDKWDLKLLGEIYTRGSWGVSAATNYRKRYRFSGSFYFSYQNTITGDKGMPDYAKEESFKIQWNHQQDPKANPFRTLTASVNFATSSYERNNLNSMYNPQTLTQSTRTSSVSWGTSFSSLGMSLSMTTNLAQNMRDSTITLGLPDLNVNVSRFYPFKRKHAAGKKRWYEQISMSYTGQLSNTITAKEDKILSSNFQRDWRNGIQHRIPINASFTLFKYITVTPHFNITDRMYSNKVLRSWDETTQTEVRDTINGFNNLYNWDLGISMSTKVYGFFVPNKKIFGDKIQAIRHVVTPTVSVSYSPDFSAHRYGYYETYQKTDADGNVSLVEYSPYQGALYGHPGKGKSENISWSLSNNIEMKVKSDKDSTGYRKLSIIDELGFNMSYNAAAKVQRWSDLGFTLRLKWWKNYTFNLSSSFATYAYELDANGRPFVGNHTEIGQGRMPRFRGMTQNISYTLNPEKLRKLFSRDRDDDVDEYDDGEGVDPRIESNVDTEMERGKHAAKKRSSGIAETDEDGYMLFSMPWSLTFGYGISMRENTSGKFNTKHMRYPYKFTQTLNVSGNVRFSDGWNVNFTSGYDFENKKVSMTTASLSRDLHCFNMSASIVLAPYTSYNFTFRCNASTLTDALKYDKHSSITNAVRWY